MIYYSGPGANENYCVAFAEGKTPYFLTAWARSYRTLLKIKMTESDGI